MDLVIKIHLFSRGFWDTVSTFTPCALFPEVPLSPWIRVLSLSGKIFLHSRVSLVIPFDLQKTTYKQQRSWDNRAPWPNETFSLATTSAKEFPAGEFCLISECCPIWGFALWNKGIITLW